MKQISQFQPVVFVVALENDFNGILITSVVGVEVIYTRIVNLLVNEDEPVDKRSIRNTC